ncbi:H(+)/Cl(-) exchange transporter ClcA [Mesorhizobium sp. BR1-1-16]|uniref:H(+)/Cl(-) exchange transporter ClcA n=1 Tax=Mesorhizobium sp. BR1-1-16 TaxID=2876653 RepID=UPI001CC9B3B9|nr:H(+)/Cl(-) exchange transporter ClcA [Mesorhizobium sp. BR1-1-16]MBZ9937169.1 H(+)/Cl(-) exchange transporter ClcA [Mesorhizobium sp. BR1-1-16]
MNETDLEAGEDEPKGSLFAIALLAPLAGALAGALGALFRAGLDQADTWRGVVISAAHGIPLAGFLGIILLAALAAAVAAFLVQRFAREASGSGIPHVELVLQGKAQQGTFRLIPVKFIGGWLAIGSGLALGREGPSVQMGATLAHLIGKWFRCDWDDCRMLLAAGAGAGLATAFNAPIGGAIFVLEELVRRFETRIAIAALGASATAIAVSRAILGDQHDFTIAALAPPSTASFPIYVIFGGIAGLVAIAYNRSILGALNTFDRFSGVPVVVKAALVGVLVGLIAWFAPELVGGGDPLTQNALLGEGTLAGTALIFAIRFVLGAVSYAAGTPGGLFAPMLVLGADLGLGVGLVASTLLPGLGIDPRGFALVGMAAFFAGVVRAPLTGLVLVAEMTASTTLLVPMLGATFCAMLVTTVLGNPPIYDSLRARAQRAPPGVLKT